jgi:hypothetical protein
VSTQASEESTRLTLTGLDGVRSKSDENARECPFYTPQRGKGVEEEELLSKKRKQEAE